MTSLRISYPFVPSDHAIAPALYANIFHPSEAIMAPPNNRKEILDKLHSSISDGNIIVGAGAGIGITAKFFEQGGGDLIIIYNSGRYRMAGRGSLAGLMPYGNANDVVLDMVCNESLLRFTKTNYLRTLGE